MFLCFAFLCFSHSWITLLEGDMERVLTAMRSVRPCLEAVVLDSLDQSEELARVRPFLVPHCVKVGGVVPTLDL